MVKAFVIIPPYLPLPVILTIALPIFLLFVPGLGSFLYTFPMEHLLKKYMPKPEKRYTENGEEIVEWYEE